MLDLRHGRQRYSDKKSEFLAKNQFLLFCLKIYKKLSRDVLKLIILLTIFLFRFFPGASTRMQHNI